MSEVNYAEFEKRMQTNPTLAMCRRAGSTHKAYGWSPVPWGNWNEEQTAAYMEGYRGEDREINCKQGVQDSE